jgi:hypothetical protein
MAPGFFQKLGDFAKKVWGGVKTAVKKVAQVGKKVWDVAKPIAAPALQMLGAKYGVPSEVSGAALGIGDSLLSKLSGEKPPPMEDESSEEYEASAEPVGEQIKVSDPGAAYYLRQGMRARK